jgi:hypothetical protein
MWLDRRTFRSAIAREEVDGKEKRLAGCLLGHHPRTALPFSKREPSRNLLQVSSVAAWWEFYMPKSQSDSTEFQGFQSPNYTQVPDELIDHLMAEGRAVHHPPHLRLQAGE